MNERGYGSVYRRLGSRFWWIQYYRDGQRCQESSNSERRKDAIDLLDRRLGEAAEEPKKPAHPLTVRDLYEALERDYLINRKKSLRNIRTEWARHLEPAFAARASSDVDVKSVEVYIGKRQAEGASNATINRELAALKRMFTLAWKTKQLKADQRPYIPMLKERNVRKGFVKNAQYDSLARETGKAGLWLRAMFEVGYTYGWRKSELLELLVRQVDLAERSITLDAGETKNDEARLVHMTDKVFELLRQAIVGKRPEDHVFTRPARAGGSVFRSKGSRFWYIQRWHEGRQVRESAKTENEAEARELLREKTADLPSGRPVSNFEKDWKRVTAAAGCPGLLFHDLRRSGVRNLIRAGVTEKVAMTISGHRTRAVFERYNIVSESDLHDAAKKLDRAAHARRQAELFEQGEMFPEEHLESQRSKKPPARAPAEAAADRDRTTTAAQNAKPN